MIAGFSLTIRYGLILGVASLAGLGCSSSLEESRYPKDLRYPLRRDLVLKEELKNPPLRLPSPGQLDESIRKACERKENEGTGLDPTALGKDDLAEIRTSLEEVFGTPASPSVEPIDPESLRERAERTGKDSDLKRAEAAEANRKIYDRSLTDNLQAFGVAPAAIDDLLVDRADLHRGSTLYRKHCLHCHGVAGDGRGPTGPWVHPHPRDYRRGQFKFVSTTTDINHRRPRRKDLYRTLTRGIDGTSMPAFGLLPEQELEALVSYVIHLSLRGQTEQDVIRALLLNKSDKSLLEGGSIQAQVYQSASLYLVQWADANKRESIKPGDYPYGDDSDKEAIAASVRSGYQHFLGKGGCMACHTDFGRQVPYRYDAWGTLVQPRNLTAGNYRGGRRPIDLYWRISGGIEPSGMSAGFKSLNEKERWDLVNFVHRLPYPAMLPQDIRDKVYGASEAKPATVASR